jgi:ABC-2 type transport system ATP-binding protein
MNMVETKGLGKRYRRTWALADCSLTVPAGCVTALVGPNGAGKTTLLHLLAGLVTPTSGTAAVLGGARPGDPAVRDQVALVAQDAPVFERMSVRDALRAARGLNGRWDQRYAEVRLASRGIPFQARVGKLSGGQRAQLALTLALARHPSLLLLDEPLAALDPLARREVLGSLLAEVLDEGVSVIFSSHVLADLENVASYLIVLGRGDVLLAGRLENILTGHRMLTGPAAQAGDLTQRLSVIDSTVAGRQAHLLARCAGAPEGWHARDVTMEEVVLGYLRAVDAGHPPGPPPVAAPQVVGAGR